MKLTAKQEKFCLEYLIDLNATQASIRAGYSTKTAQRMGSENLSKPLISDTIQAMMKETSDRTKITIDTVVERINDIAVNSEDENIQLKANDMLMKHLGGYEKDNNSKVETKITPIEIVVDAS